MSATLTSQTPKPTPLSSVRRIPKPRLLGLVFLFVLWVFFAVWQRIEHVHQCRLIHNTLSSQGESISGAVSSGIQSHRWFGPFVRQQLPSTLDVLARSPKVIAIAVMVVDDQGKSDSDQAFFAGDKSRVIWDLPLGDHVEGKTLQVVRGFDVQNDPPAYVNRSEDQPVPRMQTLRSVVVLDRSETMSQLSVEARNRSLIFGLGTLVLISVAVVWQFTVRLAQSEGKTRLLTAETRHLRELGQAAAGLAHETRNPLGLIRGWTQRLLEAGLPGEKQQQQAEAVLEECDRVTARINQFLAFARQTELSLSSVHLEELVGELRTLLQSDLEEKGLRLDTADLGKLPVVQADRDQLRQVLFNLLQNAIAFAPPQTTIALSMVSTDGECGRLEVADEGPGVSQEIVNSLFEPYVTRRSGGTGLGLSIVRRIAVAHGWEVGYKSGLNGGGVVWIDGMRSG